MQSDFEAAYGGLNTQQKQAVDQIDGPVLVIAGPGTGKTQLLSLRVANILNKTDTYAASILCLTFTNFAATNMRDRLQRLIGPAGSGVNIRTFHSFAADIMGQYPEYFWSGARLSVAPDSLQIDIVQSILADLPLDNPLASKFAGQFTGLSDVQHALKLTKEAGLTPDKLRAMIEVNIAYLDVVEPELIRILDPTLKHAALAEISQAVQALPDHSIDAAVAPLLSLSTVIKESFGYAIDQDQASGKTTETGKLKRKWLQTVDGKKGMYDERRRNAWWLAFCTAYQMYRERLHASGYYDYSDMVVEVISQLEQTPELLASVQEKYLYVLIDEFQDTNAAQLRLAHLVASHPTTEQKPNLMAVGDDDQSIFAFNGAELSNMLAFKRSYPATRTIVLKENYRSSQQILDMAAGVIGQASDRIVTREPELSKQLHAATAITGSAIEHVSYPTREHQLTAVAQRVARSWQADNEQSIVVLARNHSSLREISSILNYLNIPIRYELQNDVLQHDAVQQICQLATIVAALRAGDKHLANSHIANLIRHPVWDINGHALWLLALENYRTHDWLHSLIEHEDQHIAALGQWLLWLSGDASSEPLAVLMEYFIGLRAGTFMTSPIKAYYLLPKTINQDYLNALSAVNVLLQLVQEFAGTETPDLQSFNRFIELNKQLERPIVDQSWFMSGDKAVELMTVHKAKGLEFDSVYLIDAVESNWQPRRGGRKPPANLPLQPYGEETDDYVRLLFVAATRAKQNFIASSYTTDNRGSALLATPLLTHVLPSKAGEIVEPITVLENAISWPRLDNAEEKALLQDRLDAYSVSPSGLCSFLDVTMSGPEQFLRYQLLRVPDVQTTHSAYGTAVHAALQTAQRLINQEALSITDVLSRYEESLGEQSLPEHDIERYIPHGKQILEHLFDELDFTIPKGGKAEVSLQATLPDGAKITGRLDNVYETADEIIITDYKTGSPLSTFDTRDKLKQIKAWRHKLQLTFYALLVRRSDLFPKSKTIKTQIAYVEAENTKQLYLAHYPSHDELQALEAIIQAVWQRIQAADFPDVAVYTQDLTGIEQFITDLLKPTT